MGILDLFFKREAKHKKTSKLVVKDNVEYKYIKNKKAKNVKISIKDSFCVNVVLPYYLSYKEAEFFVKEKEDWIKKSLEKFEFNKIDPYFQTKTNNFFVVQDNLPSPKIIKKGKLVTFIYPTGADFYSKEIQEKAKLALKEALYIEAKDFLPKRLDELAKKYGFKYNKVFLKTPKTRWGSCSFANNINLNINLMNLDEKLIDYVLIHELCHTVEKNHKTPFWNLVQNCMPEAKTLRKLLKQENFIV